MTAITPRRTRPSHDRTPPAAIRVAVTDTPVAIRRQLEECVGRMDGIALVDQRATTSPGGADLVILDVDARDEQLSRLRALSRTTRVVALVDPHAPGVVVRAVHAGAVGCLARGRVDADELVRAVHEVVAGGSWVSPSVAPTLLELIRTGVPDTVEPARPDSMTDREAEILSLIARGMSNTAIAGLLVISEKTVKNHINRAYAKLGVESREQAIATWTGAVPDEVAVAA